MEKLAKLMQAQFNEMCATGKLFRSKISGQQVWDTYLGSFTKENDPTFRDPHSTSHNCNQCKNFIRRYGNIVAINEEGKLESIFHVSTRNSREVEEYVDSIVACSKLLAESAIDGVFFETFDELNSLPYESCKKTQEVFRLGIEYNVKRYTREEVMKYGRVNESNVYRFHHFHLDLPTAFVDKSGKSIGAIEGMYRDKYSVFKRAMEEIPLDTLILVKDLINQGSLLDGAAHLPILQKVIEYKQQYASRCENSTIDNWFWSVTYEMSESLAKFKNHLIGVLCSELAEGKELNDAVKAWNVRVDPVNYNKAVAPITKAQIELAKKFVEENGYVESFNRRLATIDDIKASEILHKNADNAKAKSVTMFDSITPSGIGRHKRSEFDKVEEVTIEKFMSEILPNTTNVELLMENKFEGNLVNLTTIVDKEAKPIFKWNNPFSYTFNGNLAGKSQIKDAVKSRGGETDAQVRVSIHFPKTQDDYDLHCHEPYGGVHIYYGNKRRVQCSSGMLDLDAQGGDGLFPPEKRVENLIYSDISLMPDGDYKLSVNNYSGRGLHTEFNVETEINGEITTLEFTGITKSNTESIGILRKRGNEVVYIQNNCKEIESKSTSKKLWGIDTNEFHKVNLVCLTPNHWGTDSIGNKHYLFMLQGCKNPNAVRGFHNEHLIPELLQHRKVLDVLGGSAMIEPADNQLAGVGFNATVRDEVVLRLSGSHKRIVRVKF